MDSNQCLTLMDDGTGIFWQFMYIIIDKLKKNGYDLLNHPNVQKYETFNNRNILIDQWNKNL